MSIQSGSCKSMSTFVNDQQRAPVPERVGDASAPHTPCLMAPAESATTQRARRALMGAIGFCFCFMIVEFAGGIYTHSLAVLNDAVHMITDVATLSLSLLAVHASSWRSCGKYNYGWRRAEAVGALASVFTTWALVVWILIEAIMRLVTIIECAAGGSGAGAGAGGCYSIDAPVMLYIGSAGFAANVACAFILHWGGHHGHSHGSFGGEAHHDEHDEEDHGHSHGEPATDRTQLIHNGNCDHGDHGGHGHGGNLNLRGAFLHVIGDCLQSLGVVLAAGFIWGMNSHFHGSAESDRSYFNVADPLCSVLFGVITLFTTIRLFRDIFAVLMECTPKGVSYAAVQAALARIEGVIAVQDLHIWSLGSEGAVMSTHLVLHRDVTAGRSRTVLAAAELLSRKAGIGHTTIQVNIAEGSGGSVRSEPEDRESHTNGRDHGHDHGHGHGCDGPHGHSHGH